jgi:16S rRNA (uracil1498-N3)-methyltransferase
MALRRVFVDSIDSGVSRVGGPRAHHLHRVVRLTVGEEIEISDEKQVFAATVTSSRPDLVEFDVRRELEIPGQGIAVVLLLAVIKFARFEWAIEKATELGVETIVPIVAERSGQRLVAGAVKRRGRWRKIASEAAQQSRRISCPEIENPLEFSEALAVYQAPLRLFCDTDSPPLSQVLAERQFDGKAQPTAIVLVGPEGGWSGHEREAAAEAGLTAVSMGPLILRAETAALAALACLRTAEAIQGPQRPEQPI